MPTAREPWTTPQLIGGQPPAIERWRSAERSLYPLIVSDPDLYKAAVGLVVEARDVLRGMCDTVPALLDVEAAAVLARCPAAAGLAERGLDPMMALDAARAYRWRELSGAQPDPSSATTAPGGDQRP